MNKKESVFRCRSSNSYLKQVFDQMQRAGFNGSRGITLCGYWYPRDDGSDRGPWESVSFLPLAFFKNEEDRNHFIMQCYGTIVATTPENPDLPRGTPAILTFNQGETYELRLCEPIQFPH